MVDQAYVKPCNGSEELAPRAVARNVGEFVHDVITLGELQVQLLRLDATQALSRTIAPLIALVTGGVLLLSCVPIVLACIGLLLAEYTDLSHAGGFLVALAIGLVLGGAIAIAGAMYLRKSFDVLDRSRTELSQNISWMKAMLKRLGAGTVRQREAEVMARYQ